MAKLNIKLSFLHLELPKSISLNTQRSPLGRYGMRKGIDISVRMIRKVKSKRNPAPPPTANSFKKFLLNLPPGLLTSSRCNHTFPASMNAAQ